MADCVLQRTLIRSRPGPGPRSGPGPGPHQVSPAVCRETLTVLDLQRYTRDQGSSVYFPQTVLSGEDLYDVTLTDGDCRIRVTLDPGLNRLVERFVLRSGSLLRHATFTPAMSAQLPECTGAERDSYRLQSVEVSGGSEDQEDGLSRTHVDPDSLPWFRSSEPAGPLRANRRVFLPLWNNVDYSGAAWREAPPPEEEEEEEEEEEARRPAVSVATLRDSFLIGRRGVARGVARGGVSHRLVVRIINKSHLMYYGKQDRNCECPYKAVLEVCDSSGSVCVVLWNSVCVSWYRCLKPGDIISLRRYRVKPHYQAALDDIEISVNSRNPAARIAVLPESSVSPEYRPPDPPYSFYNSKELLARPHGEVCDVIGLLTFSGRSERVRSGGQGAELMEYRWLRLEDGASDRPITVKLFSTSQPEAHSKLHPLSVVVCSRMKLVKPEGTNVFYLTNTTYTQVYCTGLGHHSQMSYRKLRPVRHFLRWLRCQDDGRVLSRALIGGFFTWPPPPVSMETYMRERRGEPGFLRGAELQREAESLCYRERRAFCIQATVTMVTYSRRGEEERCLYWIDSSSSSSSPSSFRPPPSSPSSLRPPPPSSPSSFRPPPSSPSSLRPPPSSPFSFRPPPSSPSSFRPPPSSPSSFRPPPSSPSSFRPPPPSSPSSFRPPPPSSPSSFRPPPSSPSSFRPPPSSPSCPMSPSSTASQRTPRPSGRKPVKRKLLMPDTPKRHPLVTLQPQQNNKTVILFEASMEFLENADEDDDNDDDDEDGHSSPFVPAPLPLPLPLPPPVAVETLPLRFDHAQREEQAVAVAMGGTTTAMTGETAVHHHYTLRLRALSDGVTVDAVFLPHCSSSSSSSSSSSPPVLHHSNTWTSILAHGAFSSHTPPPSPGDLINMAAQLANQRLVCVLEACRLGGASTELILSRAFQLNH